LRALQDTTKFLFYRLLLDHIEEMTPYGLHTCGRAACQHSVHIYRRPRGLFISYPLRDSIPALLRKSSNPEVDVIGGYGRRTHPGIGDQGAGGMGIPIGKLSLYTLCPVGFVRTDAAYRVDVGTNNAERLNDPGVPRLAPRTDYRSVRTLTSSISSFSGKPGTSRTCLQWEDFATSAYFCATHFSAITMNVTFNDDIQGLRLLL